MTRHFYANFNPYGSDTSVGFDNTNEVIVFKTRKERDEYVANNEDRNLSIRAITAKVARQIGGDDHGSRCYGRDVDGNYVFLPVPRSWVEKAAAAHDS